MRIFNLLIAVLYLSLLVTTETGSTHDQRLSPLADTQFQAVNLQQNSTHSTATADHEPDEPDSLPPSEHLLSFVKAQQATLSYYAPWLSFTSSPDSARAPPIA